MHPLLILLIAVAVILVMILRLRVNAFLALIAAATTVGVLSPQVPLAQVMPKLATSFGGVCAKIGIIVALAAVIGECLLESGAADKITRVFIRLFGEKRSSLSLLTSGYVLGIPVFFDTVFYLLIPLARAMRVRTGRNYLLFIMSIVAGGITTHCMVPPTPGPLAMAAALDVDLGVMILVGVLVAVPMATAGWLFARYRDRTLEVPLRETPGVTLAELSDIAHGEELRLPGFVRFATPIFLPVLLITANTFAGALGAGPGLRGALAFFGDPNFALAQGSSTVAMITTSSILAPLVVAAPPSFHPVYVACAIGGGSLVGEWMNDSAFWVYKQMSGLTEVETLKTLTPLLAVLGTTGFLVAAILSFVLPLR